MTFFYQSLAQSNHPAARAVKTMRRSLRDVSLPVFPMLVRPCLWSFVALREAYYAFRRVAICEPFLKAYCKQYGRGVHTGVYIPYIQGKGELALGDGVRIDGQFSVSFAARFSARPIFRIGDYTHVGHDVGVIVGKEVVIGSHCLIASEVKIFDSPGHPIDPQMRRAGLPPLPEQVKPVRIGDNVWIGTRVMIFPGVTVGNDSVIGAGSIVTRDVPPGTLVAGNPARPISELPGPRCEETPATRVPGVLPGVPKLCPQEATRL